MTPFYSITDRLQERSLVHILQQVAHGPGSQPFYNILVIREGREDKDLGMRTARLDLASRTYTVHNRHLYIHQHQLRLQSDA
ncbi:hypothetical protein D1872_289540 [compost metagenome]